MAAVGWVQRVRDADDERRVRIRLTPAGRALRQRASQVPEALLADSGVTLAQVRRLTSDLQALRRRLNA
jgi:DNA-binding MarR family transcriptional regulator